MGSLFLSRQKYEDRQILVRDLHNTQKGNCFICEEPIDLVVQKNSIDIDHVIPLKDRGKDDPVNFALTHASCNRSKQASNLEVARILNRFSRLRESLEEEHRSPNLGDILKAAGGGAEVLTFKLAGHDLTYSLGEVGNNTLNTVPVMQDPLSGFRYFFALLPIQYLSHDAHINPRSIGTNISKLVEEFHQKRPQLHVPLAWISSANSQSAVYVFDGQHKAAAQIMLGVRHLPLRVFIDPDPDTLITTNFNAGTTLKQVAFDKSTQRHLGSALYFDRLERFQEETGRTKENLSFSEKDLVNHYKGQSRQIKRFVLDALRTSVTSDAENKLMDFVDLGGKGNERPLSYSTIEKTFYSFFVYQEILETPLNFRMEQGENPRDLERRQILHLMNLIAENIYIDKFDSEIGTDKIESKIQKGEQYPLDHLRAYRLSKEEIIYNWLSYVGQIARQHFIILGKPDPQSRLFQYQFPEQVWDNIAKFLQNLLAMPLWVNRDLSETVFGGKQNNGFWKTVFETGQTPQGMQVLAKPLNLMDMIK
jgi:hypothetical protein